MYRDLTLHQLAPEDAVVDTLLRVDLVPRVIGRVDPTEGNMRRWITHITWLIPGNMRYPMQTKNRSALWKI